MDSLLVANSASHFSTAIYSIAIPIYIHNSTICDNYAQVQGNPWSGNLARLFNGEISNSIIWNNGYVAETGVDLPWDNLLLYIPADRISHSLVQGWNEPAPSTNFTADPLFEPTTTGQWTAPATHDRDAGQTTFFDANADWQPGELAGKLLRPDATGFRQTLIVDNTSDTLIAWGDFTASGAPGLVYQVRDYHLSIDSPCIDAGDRDFTPAVGATDIDGEPRIQGCHIDIGADEWTQDAPYRGDFDEDGAVTIHDIPFFVQTTLGSLESEACIGDVNADGRNDGRDIETFVALLIDG